MFVFFLFAIISTLHVSSFNMDGSRIKHTFNISKNEFTRASNSQLDSLSHILQFSSLYYLTPRNSRKIRECKRYDQDGLNPGVKTGTQTAVNRNLLARSVCEIRGCKRPAIGKGLILVKRNWVAGPR